MQGLGPGPHDAAPQEQQKCGRRGAEGGRGESSPQVWTLRVPDGDGDAEDEGLGGEPQAGGADLEAGGAEGAEEAAQAGAFVVDGRLLHPAPALVPAPRLGL